MTIDFSNVTVIEFNDEGHDRGGLVRVRRGGPTHWMGRDKCGKCGEIGNASQVLSTVAAACVASAVSGTGRCSLL